MAIYMQPDDVVGSSSEKQHSKWIPIKSCDFPVDRPGVNTVPGKISDRLRSSVIFPPISVTKDSDLSSPGLMIWMCNGVTKKVIIHFCKEKGDTVLELILYDTLITNLSTSVNADAQPTETIKLDFTKIEMSFFSYNEKNVKQNPTRVVYNLGTASIEG
jgi:type VI secretion system secreted protein Hcp